MATPPEGCRGSDLGQPYISLISKFKERTPMHPAPRFKPLSITLETDQEARHLIQALRLYEEYHAASSPQARFAREFLDWFHAHLRMEPEQN